MSILELAFNNDQLKCTDISGTIDPNISDKGKRGCYATNSSGYNSCGIHRGACLYLIITD